jgi:cardiolipin synthase
LSGNPLSVGNRVTLLEDGAETYRSMLAAIAAARHHVHLETYIFEAGDTGKQFADALVARAKAGVKVRVIYDSVGSYRTPKEFFKAMADGGVELLEFNPVSAEGVAKGGLDSLNRRDHRKVTIVDGRVAFLGGINISDVYGTSYAGSSSRREARERGETVAVADRPWRDMQTRIEGPGVAEIQRAFLKQWARGRKDDLITEKAYYPAISPSGPQIVRVMEGSPGDEGINDVYAAFISAIDNAEKEVRIMNPYFVPHEELRRALREAAQARRRCDAHPARPQRQLARVLRGPLVLRRPAAGRRPHLRTQEPHPAREERDRGRRLVDGGIDQPRLAKPPP